MKTPKMTREAYNFYRADGYHFTSSELYDGEPDDTYYLSDKDVSEMFIHEIVTAAKQGDSIPEDALKHVIDCLGRVVISDEDDESTKSSLLAAFKLKTPKFKKKHAVRDAMIKFNRWNGMTRKKLSEHYGMSEQQIGRITKKK